MLLDGNTVNISTMLFDVTTVHTSNVYLTDFWNHFIIYI